MRFKRCIQFCVISFHLEALNEGAQLLRSGFDYDVDAWVDRGVP
jgi:hypothetical protein